MRDIIKFDFKACKERIRVLLGQQHDPYHNFGWLHQLHLQYNLKPKYFFLVAEKKSKKDKNISPRNIEMQKLITTISKQYSIGLHPSWQSGDNFSMLKKEKSMLSSITKTQITASRQHYLRFTLPTTYQRLTEVGIEEDYSMGYAAVNGFRASVAAPFYWFDLSKNKSTNMRIYPFCFMDATSVHYKKHNHNQAFAEMLQLYKTVQNVGGLYCTLWHNDTFSNTDWASIYEELISIATK
ncbi:polysaccharide deacetylase family protein [Niabella ginsengisoli]|uniref:Polysaccharide deacetylase family protein n=1 Tax=Niabella ginsengisoli TaxID=522298 RepID=A0ABS9SQ57_9BACT|nr:polysaccharide deacetylase family protein [Niabella ginsengisoli]MCH5600489.1 polysaccharide deacetylase family protein [Niabella ginsengisoli]